MDNTQEIFGIPVPSDLDINGFQAGKHYELKLDFREDRIIAARKIIAENFVKIKSIQKSDGSYGIKHVVERAFGDHISNGELIVAMIGEGFSFERDKINCFFDVAIGSVKKLRKKNEKAEINS